MFQRQKLFTQINVRSYVKTVSQAEWVSKRIKIIEADTSKGYDNN